MGRQMHVGSPVLIEAGLTGSACLMQDRGWDCGELFELWAGQVLSCRLLLAFGAAVTAK